MAPCDNRGWIWLSLIVALISPTTYLAQIGSRDPVRQRPAVLGFERKRLQDEEVESALRQTESHRDSIASWSLLQENLNGLM